MTHQDPHHDVRSGDLPDHPQGVGATGAEETSLEQGQRSEDVLLTPRTNLYASPDGWLLIAALPQAIQDQVVLEVEGEVFNLSAPLSEGGRYQSSIRFPRGTTWGELSATWRGSLLYINLPKRSPERRSVMIS